MYIRKRIRAINKVLQKKSKQKNVTYKHIAGIIHRYSAPHDLVIGDLLVFNEMSENYFWEEGCIYQDFGEEILRVVRVSKVSVWVSPILYDHFVFRKKIHFDEGNNPFIKIKRDARGASDSSWEIPYKIIRTNRLLACSNAVGCTQCQSDNPSPPDRKRNIMHQTDNVLRYKYEEKIEWLKSHGYTVVDC